MSPSKLDFNTEFRQALEIMEKTDKNVFITGRAGTGKSTLLTYFRDHTTKKIVVLAPTGVAALNVRGATIHSFFGFKPNVTLAKVRALDKKNSRRVELYKKLDAIVIDEISMVRADLLDCVEKFMRLNGPNPNRPFGGAQMIFIGDLYQLPPVVTSREKKIFTTHYESPYFFSAKVFAPGALFAAGLSMEFIELEKVYRQKDDAFIALLNSIRNNSAREAEMAALNRRYDPDFEPPAGDFYIYLTATNDAARDINERKLAGLPGKAYRFSARISGRFDRSYYPTDELLIVKAGAQVMMLSNDTRGRWVNGTMARVTAIKKDEAGEAVIMVELPGGATEEVAPHEWDIFSYQYDARRGQIETNTVGSFRQYPLKLAWAVTIHKGQGKTFDKVVVDVGRGTFAHGQMYVALSRCTTLEGLVLKRRLEPRHIWMDWKVVRFVTRYQYDLAERKTPLKDKTAGIRAAIKNKQPLQIVYLKNNDIKSRRIIIPKRLGEMEYAGKTFLGVEAFCLTRREDRVFRVDRILEMEIFSGESLP